MERKTVFITGGTGFIGRSILKKLIDNGYKLRALVRNPASLKRIENLEVVEGDILYPETYLSALDNVATVIHLVGIIREFPEDGITFHRLHIEGTRNIVEYAREKGVKRFLHMSANGAKPEGTLYQKTKFEAERTVVESGLIYTIFRPSIVFGPDDNFLNYLRKLMQFFVVPYIGDGLYELQPVSIETVASIFVSAITNTHTFNKIYSVCGPQRFSYKELLDIIAKRENKKILKLRIPIRLIGILAFFFERFRWFPITREQVEMLTEGNICDSDEIYRVLNITPTSLEEYLRFI